MRIFLRKILSNILDKESKQKLKELEYKTRKQLIKKLPVISEEKFKKILVKDLGIKKGDNLFIHASLDMVNTDLTPLQILNILLDIVGEKGSVSVPTFIRYGSKEWMEMPKNFDIKKTPSGMGIFSERVRRHKFSYRSIHPTKSVASIGPIAQEITSEHHLSLLPFGEKSPFYKLMKYHNVKVISLGAPMSYLSMVHVVEDMNIDIYPVNINEEKVYEKRCITSNKENISVSTYVHNLSILAKANPEKFVKKYMKEDQYKIINHYLTPFFVVNGPQLLEQLNIELLNGNTIYD